MRINEEFIDTVEQDDIQKVDDTSETDLYPFTFIFGTEIYPDDKREDLYFMKFGFKKLKRVLNLCKTNFITDGKIYTDSDELVDELFGDVFKLQPPLRGAMYTWDYDYLCGYVFYTNKFKSLKDLFNVFFYGRNIFDKKDGRGESFAIYRNSDNKNFTLWHSWMRSGYMITYKDVKSFYKKFILDCEIYENELSLKEFCEKLVAFIDFHENELSASDDLREIAAIRA